MEGFVRKSDSPAACATRGMAAGAAGRHGSRSAPFGLGSPAKAGKLLFDVSRLARRAGQLPLGSCTEDQAFEIMFASLAMVFIDRHSQPQGYKRTRVDIALYRRIWKTQIGDLDCGEPCKRRRTKERQVFEILRVLGVLEVRQQVNLPNAKVLERVSSEQPRMRRGAPVRMKKRTKAATDFTDFCHLGMEASMKSV